MATTMGYDSDTEKETSRDKITASPEFPPQSNNSLKPAPPGMPRRSSSPAFRTHVPGIFDKIQAKLDPSVKLVADDTEEELRFNKPNKVVKSDLNYRGMETGTLPAEITCTSSVLKSGEPLEIADQCLAEFEVAKPKIQSRDVTSPSHKPAPSVEQKPTAMIRRASAPSMQAECNQRGFKTHIPGIFDKIQSKLDSSVQLIDEEVDGDIINRPKKTPKPIEKPVTTEPERKPEKPSSTNLEREPEKPTNVSRSSSVLSSDDPIEIADQCLAEFQGPRPNIARVGMKEPKQDKPANRVQDYVTDRSVAVNRTPSPDVITPFRDVSTPSRDVILSSPKCVSPSPGFKPSSPAMNRAVSPQNIQANEGGFKTHVPGIFGKIQAKLDTKLVADEDEELVKHNKVSASRFNNSPASEMYESEKRSKPAPMIRASTLPNSNDPIEMADQFLAEFGGAKHNIPSRNVISSPRESPPPVQPIPTSEPRRASHPAMPVRGFKTHVPGIFDKIQAKLDPSVKLVAEEQDDTSGGTDSISPRNDTKSSVGTKAPLHVIDQRLANIEVDDFQNHVPDVFNKIQQKLYFSPEVKEGDEIPSS